ncbi:CDP-glycerol glycerophosphotransferase family protein [Jeotgalibacillus sp. S-D1]|uniref:CDP-glycerol glycerophosphotransferase family protein n=1 Tax=Jeotgalibacillus sp. S-D1 TaxID=2552189 RepID=UPI0010596F1D|nr:CDP-glycerol glycerophosphotransferase family protein [Jeotgalibacillus sp. S-D1]TDL32618.1 CDP-glycerol glycerophosphotransferase family protein [Jeotgalibacillus sp. S-D1]
MIIDVIKTLYLALFKIVFSFYNMQPLQKKIVMYVTFRQNAHYILQELKKRPDSMEIILICNRTSYEGLLERDDKRVKLISLEDKRLYFKRIYHLATAKLVVVDNYFAFLAVSSFKKDVECIQIWHAAGAVKSFGLEDKSTTERTAISLKRFRQVYNRFTKIVVGSDEMAGVFTKAFGLEKDVFLRTGIPRTDLFYSDKEKDKIRASFYRDYPHLADKKIALYAPTFRDHPDHQNQLDLSFLQKELGEEYFFIIKFHPVTKQSIILPEQSGSSFLLIDADYDVNELLQVTDVLITDYSSIPFEYCLLGKPMIFFAYDLKEYSKERGIWANYDQLVPGPVVTDTESLIEALKQPAESVPMQRINMFCEEWNKYSKGYSSKNLVDYMLEKL